MSDMMAEAHRRDYDRKRIMDEARRALVAVLEDAPLRPKERQDAALQTIGALANEADRIVRAWN